MTKFKPILFSTPMVQAILEDRKTQTRRIIKPQPSLINDNIHFNFEKEYYLTKEQLLKKAPIQPGNVLWVRETWFPTRFDYKYLLAMGANGHIKYRADGDYDPKKDCVGRSWKPSIFMPKEACRIFLEVTEVRVERVQDISEDDSKAEGIRGIYNVVPKNHNDCWLDYTHGHRGFDSPVHSFRSLWLSINGQESWEASPWVWVYEFKRIEKPSNF